MADQALIKTTAKFQDNKEPIKQRPIIQYDRPPPAALPNTVRSSIESGGRDNPFRPDGEIYKSADPIVDYYKYGPNQSRTQSPTDSQLLLNGSQGSNGEVSTKKKIKTKRKKRGEATEVDGDGTRRSCWRKWLCCCCFCRCCRKKDPTDTAAAAAATTTTTTITANDDGNINKPGVVEVTRGGATAAAPALQVTGSKQEKQTKVVVLRDEDNSIVNRPAYSFGTKNSPIELNIDQSQPIIDGGDGKMGEEPKKGKEKSEKIEIKRTEEKSTRSSDNKSSRCVVS